MEKTSKKKSWLFAIVASVICLVVPVSAGIAVSVVKNNASAIKTGDTSSFYEIGELYYGDGYFNKNEFNKFITSLSSATSVSALNVDTPITANTIFTGAYGSKPASKSLVVTLGGLKWQVVYVSKDVYGNKVATLWLTNCEQDAFAGRSSIEGEYYGYVKSSSTGKTGLYSDWSANWYDTGSNWTSAYPSSMYGMSYMRAVTLNNGGAYSVVSEAGNGTNSSVTKTYEKSADSAFAVFTMPEAGLTKYIVQPKNMPYQTSSQKGNCSGMSSYVYMNDSLATNLTGYYSSNNFQTMTGYTNWGDDYLWLPSMQEMGYNNTDGLWKTIASERMNYDGSTTSTVGKVGSVSGDAFPYSWSRSSNYSYSNYAYYVNPSGSSSITIM